MKKLSAILLIAISCILSFSVVSCGTVEKTVYKAEAGTVVAVDTAMRAWGSYVAQFKPGVEKEKKVKEAYDTYRQAMLDAIDASIALKRLNTPSSEQEAIKAYQKVSEALNELLTLLRTLGVKI